MAMGIQSNRCTIELPSSGNFLIHKWKQLTETTNAAAADDDDPALLQASPTGKIPIKVIAKVFMVHGFMVIQCEK